MIRFTTNMGVFDVELNEAAAPKTCENFLSYVRSGFYNGTIFHRGHHRFSGRQHP